MSIEPTESASPDGDKRCDQITRASQRLTSSNMLCTLCDENSGLYCKLQCHEDESICWMTNVMMYYTKVDGRGAVSRCVVGLREYSERAAAFACVCASCP